jgi:hypothetical protein
VQLPHAPAGTLVKAWWTEKVRKFLLRRLLTFALQFVCAYGDLVSNEEYSEEDE